MSLPTSFFSRLCPLLLAFALTAQAQDTATPPSAATPTPADSGMDSQLFYEILLGELHLQSEDLGVSYSLMLDAARKTGNAKLFQRAVDIARQGRAGESALQAARAWRQALPKSRDANRYLLQILIDLNRLNDSVEPIKREVALTPEPERAATIAGLARYFGRTKDKKLAAQTLEAALVEHLHSAATGASAWTTIGSLRLDANDAEGALAAARRGQALAPQAQGPALLAIALLDSKPAQAESLVRKYLEGKPTVQVRMAYARALLSAQHLPEAAAQLHLITTEKPDYTEAWLVQGALQLQNNKLPAAESSFLRYLELASGQSTRNNSEAARGLSQAYLSLAQIAEQRKDYGQAESWLNKITHSDDMVRSQSRRASILARQGKMLEARQLIGKLPERNADDVRMKVSAEVQLLREHKLYREAYDLLARANQSGTPDFDLLYDQATLAEKLGDTDGMERLLKRIMLDKPSYLHAYNALGYSLADRNIRLAEAKQLILKALEMAPNDPFISDSLGWVEFRSGNFNEALRILQRAFKSKPDAEIAAHLGEVLWSLGQRDAALDIWREGKRLNAENETLVETLKRLRVQL